MVRRKGRGGQKRKRDRILANEKSKKQKNNNNIPSTSTQQQQTQEFSDAQHNVTPSPPPPAMEASSSRQPPPQPKRGRKKKRLDEVAVTSSVGPTAQQNGEKPKHEVPPVSSAILPSTQQMPEKRMLEFILDILQRRDTHEIFAQPVDPNEVEGYYSIIQKPMDFGTMRAKLQEGMYTTLEQFKHDVFLISNNAMLFNSSATIYFRQARAIHELAKRVFHNLKFDPKKIELEFPLIRRRGRKSQGETRCSRVKLGAKLRGNNLTYQGSSGGNLHDNEILPGFRDRRNVNLCKTERRQTYKPSAFNESSIVSTVYRSSKQLAPGNGGIGYKESLLRFAKDLGPTAQKVANRKLRCLTQTSSHSIRDSSHLISSLVAQQPPSCIKGVINGATADANNLLRCHGATSRGKNTLTSESIDINSSTCRGKMALGLGRLDIQGAASKGENILAGDSMDPYGGGGAAATYKGKSVLIGDGMDPYGGGRHRGASKGKSVLTGDCMDPYGDGAATYKWKSVLIGDCMDSYGGCASKGKSVLTSDSMDPYGDGVVAAYKEKNVLIGDGMDPYGGAAAAATYKGKSVLIGDGIYSYGGGGGGASKGKSVLTGDSIDPYGGACGGKTALVGRGDSQGALCKTILPCSDTTGIQSALQWERAHSADRKAIDQTLNRDMAAYKGPSRGMTQSSDKKALLTRGVGEDSARHSESTKGWLGLEFPTNEGLNSTAGKITDANCKYMDLLQGAIKGDIAHCNQNTQNQLFSHLPNAGTVNIHGRSFGMTDSCSKYTTADRMMATRQLGDQVQPSQLASRSQSRLLEFISRGNRHPKSTVYPSIVVKPSGSSQANTLLHGLDKESNAPLDLNYGASSTQVTQPLEWSQPTPWGPQAIYDFPQVKPQFGEVNPLPLTVGSDVNPLGQDVFAQQQSQFASAPYMQVQPNEVNPLGQDAVLQQELQLALAQSTQPIDANVFGQDILAQQGSQFTSTPYMQPQPDLLNLLGQESFVVQQEPQLPMESYMQPLTNC